MIGISFPKVNFLRLERWLGFEPNYFPGVDLNSFDENAKKAIINEIEEDFRVAYEGIVKLPIEAKFGVLPCFIKIA
jgi:hypothetical protein